MVLDMGGAPQFLSNLSVVSGVQREESGMPRVSNIISDKYKRC